jgi:hypothetical protein
MLLNFSIMQRNNLIIFLKLNKSNMKLKAIFFSFPLLLSLMYSCSETQNHSAISKTKKSNVDGQIRNENLKKEVLLDNGGGFINFNVSNLDTNYFLYNKLSSTYHLDEVVTINLFKGEKFESRENDIKINKGSIWIDTILNISFNSCEVFKLKNNGYDCVDKKNISSLTTKCQSYFVVSSDTFYLKDIFNPLGKAYTEHNFRLGDVISFTFKGVKFLAINVLESCLNETTNSVRVFLVRITDDKEITFIQTPYFQGKQTLGPFNDFNEDGKLDYVGWNWDSMLIELFSLEGNNFVKNNAYFIKLKSTDYSEGYEEFTIDYNKSKWINSLREIGKIPY